MWLFYVDEFGDDSMALASGDAVAPKLKQGVSEWFILSAVGIPSHSRLIVADQLIALKDHHFRGWQNRPWCDTEIKGRHLKQAAVRLDAGKPALRPEGFKKLDKHGAQSLCDDLGWMIRKYRPIIYVIAVNKQEMLDTGKNLPPVAVAYAYLQQRLALLVEHVLGPSEGVVIVADEQSGHERDFRAGRFHTVRKALANGLTTQPKFDLLLDKPVWVNAELSSVDREILQLADIVAFEAGETCLTGMTPTAHYCLWEHIATCLALNWRTHRVTGGGFTIYPRPGSYPKGL
jgi:hypothetical protein